MNKVINQLKMHRRRMMENDKQQENDGCPARGAGTSTEFSGMGLSTPGSGPETHRVCGRCDRYGRCRPGHLRSRRGDKWPGINRSPCLRGAGSGKCAEPARAGSGMAEHVAEPRGQRLSGDTEEQQQHRLAHGGGHRRARG